MANMARILAIVHIIVGFYLSQFGIADRAVEYFWTGYGCYGIWTGAWVSNACFISILLMQILIRKECGKEMLKLTRK